MSTLSNNRSNATQLGLWYVNANNAPSNANATNWGARQSPQTRMSHNCLIGLNRKPIKGAFGLVRKECVGQFPLIQRSLVVPSQDGDRTDAMRKRRRMAA